MGEIQGKDIRAQDQEANASEVSLRIVPNVFISLNPKIIDVVSPIDRNTIGLAFPFPIFLPGIKKKAKEKFGGWTCKALVLSLLAPLAPYITSLGEKVTASGLVEVSGTQQQLMGIAVFQEGRIFVNFPRWVDNIHGRPPAYVDGTAARFNSDDIAIDSGGRYLYCHALTGRTLYGIETRGSSGLTA